MAAGNAFKDADFNKAAERACFAKCDHSSSAVRPSPGSIRGADKHLHTACAPWVWLQGQARAARNFRPPHSILPWNAKNECGKLLPSPQSL